jgi:hypothetical protein
MGQRRGREGEGGREEGRKEDDLAPHKKFLDPPLAITSNMELGVIHRGGVEPEQWVLARVATVDDFRWRNVPGVSHTMFFVSCTIKDGNP